MGNKRATRIQTPPPAPTATATAQRRPRHPSWTPALRQALVEYVPLLVTALRLNSWDITVDFETPAAAGSYAEITPHQYQKRAVVRFGSEFLTLDAASMRQTLVHELLHCHLFGLHHLSEEMLTQAVGRKRAALGLVALEAEVETVTDGLADVIAALLPLPDFPGAAPAPTDFVAHGTITFVGVLKGSSGPTRKDKGAARSR